MNFPFKKNIFTLKILCPEDKHIRYFRLYDCLEHWFLIAIYLHTSVVLICGCVVASTELVFIILVVIFISMSVVAGQWEDDHICGCDVTSGLVVIILVVTVMFVSVDVGQREDVCLSVCPFVLSILTVVEGVSQTSVIIIGVPSPESPVKISPG